MSLTASSNLAPRLVWWRGRGTRSSTWRRFSPQADTQAKTIPWVFPRSLSEFIAAGEKPIYVGFGSMTDVDQGVLGQLEFTAVRSDGLHTSPSAEIHQYFNFPIASNLSNQRSGMTRGEMRSTPIIMQAILAATSAARSVLSLVRVISRLPLFVVSDGPVAECICQSSLGRSAMLT